MTAPGLLSEEEVDRLLSRLDLRSFRSRDEQEVAGYADVMEFLFAGWRDMPLSQNHVKQLHATLLRCSDKDERHRGEYKTLAAHVEAFGADGQSLGVVVQTATPFDTPRLTEELFQWTNAALDAGVYHPLLVLTQSDQGEPKTTIILRPEQQRDLKMGALTISIAPGRDARGTTIPRECVLASVQTSAEAASVRAGSNPYYWLSVTNGRLSIALVRLPAAA